MCVRGGGGCRCRPALLCLSLVFSFCPFIRHILQTLDSISVCCMLETYSTSVCYMLETYYRILFSLSLSLSRSLVSLMEVSKGCFVAWGLLFLRMIILSETTSVYYFVVRGVNVL